MDKDFRRPLRSSGWVDIIAFMAGILFTVCVLVFFVFGYDPEPIDDYAIAVGVGFLLLLALLMAIFVLAGVVVFSILELIVGLRMRKIVRNGGTDVLTVSRIHSSMICPIIYLILFSAMGFFTALAASSAYGIMICLCLAALVFFLLIASIALKGIAASRLKNSLRVAAPAGSSRAV